MSRTNIELDEELVTAVMKRYRLASKRAAVDFALRQLVAEPYTYDEVLALEGVGWSGNLDVMRDQPVQHI